MLTIDVTRETVQSQPIEVPPNIFVTPGVPHFLKDLNCTKESSDDTLELLRSTINHDRPNYTTNAEHQYKEFKVILCTLSCDIL